MILQATAYVLGHVTLYEVSVLQKDCEGKDRLNLVFRPRCPRLKLQTTRRPHFPNNIWFIRRFHLREKLRHFK
ncbi:hypothetical protein Y032_0651g1153 [Ancylostoma ceylanicum]|uniref:Uncharacterized protein n=1 Tax=Ancylostoma ceylanicum TaxID=53326 RepID=A0A016WIF6_9BILA|nr:hypothetical protein Y032_0651g1153 [Ancylostoma ceylanicum]